MSDPQKKNNNTAARDFGFIFGSVLLGFLVCAFIVIVVGLVVYKKSVTPMIIAVAEQQRNANIIANQQMQILREISKFMQQQQIRLQAGGYKTAATPQAAAGAGGPGLIGAARQFGTAIINAPGAAYEAAANAGNAFVKGFGGTGTRTQDQMGNIYAGQVVANPPGQSVAPKYTTPGYRG